MTVPPEEPARDSGTAPDEPGELDFDPYRFGLPDHPVPPEYAPPGYTPPAPSAQATPGTNPPPPAPPRPGYGAPANWQAHPGPPVYQAGPPSPPHAFAPPRRSTGKAITSMVLGIVSILLSITSVIDIIPVVLAVVFGVLALAQAGNSPHREGRGMAIAGLVCAGVGTVLAVLVTVWYVHTAKQCDQYDSGSSQFQTCVRDHL